MSTNYMLRDQYRLMANIGTPDLTQAAKLQRIRDLRHGLTGSSPHPKLKEVRFGNRTHQDINSVIAGIFLKVTRLLKNLSVEDTREESVNLTLHPILENSQKLLQSSKLASNVKKAVETLLEMTKCSLRLHAVKPGPSYFEMFGKVLTKNYGVTQTKQFRKNQIIDVNLQKNHETNLGFSQIGMKKDLQEQLSRSLSEEKVVYKNKQSFGSDHFYGRNVEKSNYPATNPNQFKGKFVRVTKKYWMANTTICWNNKTFPGDKEMLEGVLLGTLPENFSWLLKYLSCYSSLPTVDLLEELVTVEKIILHLDPDYFGFPASTHVEIKKPKKKKTQSCK